MTDLTVPGKAQEMREASEVQSEIRRAVARIRIAHEILARLVESDDDSIRELLRSRAESLGARLTETELEVISQFVGGRSPASIAEDRGLAEKTVSNQLRTGYQKLGFSDRRELKGWGTAVSGFIVANPPKD